MAELTVENMFTETFTSVTETILADTLGALDRKRMLAHIVNDVVARVLTTSGTNPVGLAITVTMGQCPETQRPTLVVVGSAPQYDLSDDFFL